MNSAQLSVAGMSAPYGQACAGCAKAKSKCVSRGNGTCERCHRRGVECRVSDGIRKRGSKKPDISHRTSKLEERLNDLVEILRSQQSGKKVTPAEQNLDTTSAFQSSTEHSSAHGGTGTYPTPTTANTSSASQLAADSGTLCDDDELSSLEAEEILHLFRDKYLAMFPFVWIKKDTTAQELQRYRPFLWLNIRTVCEKNTPRLHMLGYRIREILARKVLVELERDIDVLLGLLVYLGWFVLLSTYQTRGKGFQARYANLANSLVQDLRFDQPCNINSSTNCFVPGYVKMSTSPEQTHEQRRAVLATFILCSTASTFLRIDVTRWTSHMDSSLEKLAAEPECQGDELLVAIARVKFIIEDISRVTWKQADYGKSEPPVIYVKPLRERLEWIKRSVSPELANNRVFISHLYDAEVLIAEMAIFHPISPFALPNPSAAFPASIPIPAINKLSVESEPALKTPIKPVDLSRLQMLHSCLQNIKKGISNYLSFEPVEHISLPFAIMCHVSRWLQTLYRLTVLEEPDWDQAAVRQEADIITILNQAADKMSKVAAAAGLTGDPTTPYGDIFTKGAGTLRATASIWSSTLPPLEEAASVVQIGDMVGAESTEIPPDPMTMMLDFENDPWLADLFSSWEGGI